MGPHSSGSREREATLSMFAVLAVIGVGVVGVTAQCPWDQGGLTPWTEASSWDSGLVPGKNDKVVIPTGKKILLDTSVNLKSLTIEQGAELVWGDVPDLELRTSFILIDGAFHMGSDSCRLTQRAKITLTGRSDSNVFMIEKDDSAIIRKAIMVQKGGTLEIHGAKKTSWTHLAQTMPRVVDQPCSIVYNHSDYEANPHAADRSTGMHVIVWNADGTVFDYTVLQIFTPLKSFISTIPDGKVIGMTAFSKDGLQNRDKAEYDFDTLDDVIEQMLGGNLYAQTKPTQYDSYSLVTIKGSPASTQEFFKARGKLDVDFYEDYIQLPVWETELSFQVATSAKTEREYFRVLQAQMAYPILELADDVTGWEPGDKLVVASTDFDWRQTEVREIIPCDTCSESQIRVNASFRYRHFGNFTYLVDERAEVGLLSRNILIEGETEPECYFTNEWEEELCKRFGEDTFGGHIKFLRGFHSVHVQGAELYHMGQQNKKGNYPLHYHMCDTGEGSWVRDNSIHHTFSRCVTVHGTDNVEVSGIVCYKHLGHGFFLEDSVEQNNVLKYNLGIGTMFGTLLMSDSTKPWCEKDLPKKEWTISCAEVSTFWITHPNNELIGNAAAGSDCHGFMYSFADVPLGPSYERQLTLKKVPKYHAKSYPVKKFYKNSAHSNERSGIFFDSYISAGGLGDRDFDIPENGIIQSENLYEPRDPAGDINGKRVWTKLERVTVYKNRQNNLWIKGGNINITFSSQADPASQSFSGGCTGFQTGSSLEYSVVIGRTDNLGEPRVWNEIGIDGQELSMTFDRSIGKTPWSTLTGVGIYQGPMYVKHTYFDRFQTQYWNDTWTKKLGRRPVSHAGALSFKKDSTYPTYTSQYTTNLTFGFCDNQDNGHHMYFGEPVVYDWSDTCGPRNAYNHDRDGSLTGTPETSIVRDRPFFTGSKCRSRSDWGMSMCPYRYIKVEFKGFDGSLSNELHDQYPLVARRDDHPDDPFYQKAAQRMEYLTRTYTSILVGMNTSLPGAKFPTEFRVFGYGVEKQDVARVGLCVPKDLSEFEVISDYPTSVWRTNFSRVYSLQDLDDKDRGHAIFHDIRNGIIFFKIWSKHDRTNDSQLCPAGNCFKLRITFKDGNLSAVRDCFDVNVKPFEDYRKNVVFKKPEKTPCKIGSPEGLGAVRWEEVPKIVHEEFSVRCMPGSIARSIPPTEHKGCIVEETQNNAFELEQNGPRTMTVDWCIQRCAQRGYKYAGLTRGSVCSCSHTFYDTPAAYDVSFKKCVKRCAGSPRDRLKTCGNGQRLDVWKIGF